MTGDLVGMFGDNEAAETVQAALGKKVARVWLDEDTNTLHFQFTDGTGMRLYDSGQSCCEIRYMRTDDDLSEFADAVLRSIELVDAADAPDAYYVHEIQQLVVKTDKGTFVVSNHNQHNGYYDGFWIVARPTSAENSEGG